MHLFFFLVIILLDIHHVDKVYDDIYQELEEIAMKDESLKKTFKNWEELSMEQEQKELYEGRLKRIMDEEAAKREAELRLQEAEQKAKQEGRLEGRQEEKETIARRLLAEDMDIEFVSNTTGLTKDKVTNIQRNL